MRPRLELGAWNAICDRCGFQFKNYQLRQTWDNLRVCPSCFETKHPSDITHTIPVERPVPWTRTQGDLVFVVPQYCTIRGKTAVAGYAVAGCAISGSIANLRSLT